MYICTSLNTLESNLSECLALEIIVLRDSTISYRNTKRPRHEGVDALLLRSMSNNRCEIISGISFLITFIAYITLHYIMLHAYWI